MKVELNTTSLITMANQRAGRKRNYRHPFFTIEAMHGFNTYIPIAYLLNADRRIGNMQNDIIFITGDDTHDHATRRFTVRRLDGEGEITNVSGFQEFETLARAKTCLNEYVAKYGQQAEASEK